MPDQNFPWYIRPATTIVEDDHLNYSVLLFETADAGFIAVADTQDTNELTHLAAGLSNQTGFAWAGFFITAARHNDTIRAAMALRVIEEGEVFAG